MKHASLLALACVLLVIAGCSSVSVKTDFDSEANFTSYRTFKWVPRPARAVRQPVIDNPINEARVRRAVEWQLTQKGYRYVETGPADLLIAYHMGVQTKIDVDAYGYHYWRRPYRDGKVVEVHKYKEGTLVLDFIDAGRKQLVWRGVAQGALARQKGAEDTINSAVSKILKQYPPDRKD